MFSRRMHILVLVVALASAAAIAPGKASADLYAAPDLYDFGNFCTSVSPDASLTLGANTPSVKAVSRGGAYWNPPCYRFVTDIHVPTTSSGGSWYLPEFVIGGGYAGSATGPEWANGPALSQSDCGVYHADLRVYRRNVRDLNSAFTFVGGGSLHGSWIAGGETFGPAHYCAAVEDSGYVDLPNFSPPTSTEAVYRVVIGVKVGTWKQVSVAASHLSFIA